MSQVLVVGPAALAAGVVLVAVAGVRPTSSRLHELAPAPPPATDPVGVITRLGSLVRRPLGVPPDPRADRSAGFVVVVALALVVVAPPLGVLWASAAVIVSVVRRRRATQRRTAQLVDELPEVVDLLWLSVSAGLTVTLALAVVERHGTGRLATALAGARRRAALGHGLADALDQVPSELGESVRPVTRVLASALRDGTPVADALERVAAEVRLARRRAAEERARRVSVRLLFPLVFCVLPAFALLTVVPLLAGALRGLAL